MPWDETTPMDQRLQFVADLRRGTDEMSVLCRRYGVSRERFGTQGEEVLEPLRHVRFCHRVENSEWPDERVVRPGHQLDIRRKPLRPAWQPVEVLLMLEQRQVNEHRPSIDPKRKERGKAALLEGNAGR